MSLLPPPSLVILRSSGYGTDMVMSEFGGFDLPDTHTHRSIFTAHPRSALIKVLQACS